MRSIFVILLCFIFFAIGFKISSNSNRTLLTQEKINEYNSEIIIYEDPPKIESNVVNKVGIKVDLGISKIKDIIFNALSKILEVDDFILVI